MKLNVHLDSDYFQRDYVYTYEGTRGHTYISTLVKDLIGQSLRTSDFRFYK